MDNSLKKLVCLSGILLILAFAFVAALGFVYRYFTIRVYNSLIIILILLVLIFTLAVLISIFTAYYTYSRKSISPCFAGLLKLCMNVLMPALALLGSFSGADKDDLRRLYIDVNNILVQSKVKGYLPQEVMLIVPHCLQESGCGYKITRDIGRCRRCGNCCMGEIARLVEETGIKAAVVTGGTAARQEVKKNKPRIILSVACERDLYSGISDIRSIPVVGVINQRPNGPCYNTYVDVNILREKVYSFIGRQ